jgi:hypothetical protein
MLRQLRRLYTAELRKEVVSISFQELTQNLTKGLRKPTKNVGYVTLSPSRDFLNTQ